MRKIAKALNGFLHHFDLHVGRASSLEGLRDQLRRTQEQLNEACATPKRTSRETEFENQLNRSKERWRGDEPDAGLTWGVRMEGDEFVRFVRSHARLDEQSTIVEVGPGYGRILGAMLKERIPFRRYVGLEISASRVERLRQQFADPRIEFREADVLQPLDLGGAPADLTFSSAVFEHLYPDFGAALRTIASFTKVGGSVALDFVRDDDYLEKSAAWFEKETTYIRVYAISELEELFRKNGFEVAQIGRISFGQDIEQREIARTIVLGTRQ
jgi:ubiquinone/menaquinone biosynthesis C-methylase UbiE